MSVSLHTYIVDICKNGKPKYSKWQLRLLKAQFKIVHGAWSSSLLFWSQEKTNAFLYFIKTSKFEWKLDDIRMEKIISATILATKYFLEVSALLDIRHYPKLQSCAISRKYNNATLRKWQKTLTFVSWVLPLLLFRQWFSIILCNFQEN